MATNSALNKAENETARIFRYLSLAPSTFYYRIKHRACKLINTRLEIAMKSIHDEMDGIYGKRRHYKLGFISPAEFESNLLKTA